MDELAVPPSTSSSLRYIPGLDVLRGVAIAMVFLYHGLAAPLHLYAQSPRVWMRSLPAVFELGHYGVHLFFVLSGFLITGILLDTRNDPDYFRNFYMRRVLRIAPAYLALLVILRSFGWIDTRFLLVALLFLCNMSSPFHPRLPYRPLWSLAVEEQFYLLWPLVVRRLSRRALSWMVGSVIALTPVLRFGLLHGPVALRDIAFKTWVVWDFFAAGAALALVLRLHLARPMLVRSATALTVLGLLGMLGLSVYSLHSALNPARWLLATTLEPWLLFFTGCTLFAALVPGSWGLRAVAPLLFLARISYGLYLIHVLVIDAVEARWHVGRMAVPPLLEILLRLALEASISIGIAWVSRNTLERYFLRLKPRHHRASARVEIA